MSVENDDSIIVHLNQYCEIPYLWYHMNPKSVIHKYNLSPQEGLELYSVYVKDQRLLYSTVIKRNSMYMEKMADIALFLGWIINLIGIITPVTETNISDSVMILLTGVGNLVAIMISTIVKYLSIDDKIQLFKLMEISLHRLYDEIEFHIAHQHNDSEEENRRMREEACLQVHNKINDIKTLCPFVISKSTLEYHYGQEYIIQLNKIAINDLLDSLMKNDKKTIQVANEI